MCEVQLAAHPELWQATSAYLETRGRENDLKMWEQAEHILGGQCRQHEHVGSNEAAYMALGDAFFRCKEERRRAEELLPLHEVWEGRRIGGVMEPEPVVRPPEQIRTREGKSCGLFGGRFSVPTIAREGVMR